ncbi:MAG: hypothetical protein FJW27_11850 [Acidimicrobiia bacterium]|nr:hypothetical protein [Acidimicrobiia bacterium]
MSADRGKQVVLAVLVVGLLAAVYSTFSGSGGGAEPGFAGGVQRGDLGPDTVAAPDVRLESLDEARVRPAGAERNLFRFGTRAAANSRPREAGLPPPTPAVQPGPTVPSVPPIALKFIGVVQATAQSQIFAVLRDDRGVYHGREGDIIEGRYRILRIGTESVELAYVNGTGRQTIRLGS